MFGFFVRKKNRIIHSAGELKNVYIEEKEVSFQVKCVCVLCVGILLESPSSSALESSFREKRRKNLV